LHHATGCRHSIWNPFCKRWRAAATNWRAHAASANEHSARRRQGRRHRRTAGGFGNKVVLPTLASAEHEFGVALGRINLDDMARDAGTLGVFLRADRPRTPRSRSGLFRRDFA